jgi:hypothetical protein
MPHFPPCDAGPHLTIAVQHAEREQRQRRDESAASVTVPSVISLSRRRLARVLVHANALSRPRTPANTGNAQRYHPAFPTSLSLRVKRMKTRQAESAVSVTIESRAVAHLFLARALVCAPTCPRSQPLLPAWGMRPALICVFRLRVRPSTHPPSGHSQDPTPATRVFPGISTISSIHPPPLCRADSR